MQRPIETENKNSSVWNNADYFLFLLKGKKKREGDQTYQKPGSRNILRMNMPYL